MKTTISVCHGKSCTPNGSARVMRFLEDSANELNTQLKTEAELKACECLGHCEKGPNISVNGNVANGVTPENALKKIDEMANCTPRSIDLDLDKLAYDL